MGEYFRVSARPGRGAGGEAVCPGPRRGCPRPPAGGHQVAKRQGGSLETPGRWQPAAPRPPSLDSRRQGRAGAPPQRPKRAPLPSRRLQRPPGPQGTKRSFVPEITPDAKAIFPPAPEGEDYETRASDGRRLGGGGAEGGPPGSAQPAPAGRPGLQPQNTRPPAHTAARDPAGLRTQAGLTAKQREEGAAGLGARPRRPL